MFYFLVGGGKLSDFANNFTIALFSSPLLVRNASIISSRLNPCFNNLLIDASEKLDDDEEEVAPADDEDDLGA